MLVLTRYPHQKIVIGKDIFIEVIKVQGNQVRIGIDAPREINIAREELLRDNNEWFECPLCGSDSHGNNSNCQRN